MKLYDKVKDLLTKYPALRDSDKKLTWSVWMRELNMNNNDSLTYDKYLQATSFETISRCRRKIQERHPELRGSDWVNRAKKSKQATKGTFIYQEPFTGKLF